MSDMSGSNMDDDGAANHCSDGATGAKDVSEMETADNNHCAASAKDMTVAMETADSNHCAAKSCGTCDTDHDSDSEVATSPLKSADALYPGDAELYLGSLKKDDSGIVCEKSPVRETEGSRAELDSASAKSRTHHPSTSNESEGVVADFADDSEVNGPLDVSLRSESAEDVDEDDDDVEVSVRKKVEPKRRRSRSRSADSSSQSEAEERSSSPDDSHDNEAAAKSDDEEEGMDVGATSAPKDPWRPVHELRQREVGHNARFPASQLFRIRTGSSVNLVQRMELQGKLEHHDGCVNALHFNDSGTLLASGSDDLNIVIWDWAYARKYMVFDSGHRSNVFQSKFMPYSEDMHIVSCARDGQIRLAELSTTGVCKGTKKLAQHRGAAHKLALLNDSSHVFYSCGEDGVIYEIDLRQDKPNKLCTTKENNKKVQLYSIHSNPFKSYEFCVGGRDHYIRIYDKRMLGQEEEAPVVKKFCPHHLQRRASRSPENDRHRRAMDSAVKANVTCAVYNYNGTEILGTYNDEHIYLFDNEHSDGANYIHRYLGHRNNATVKGVNFYGPRSEFVISGSDCSNIILWHKETEKIVQFFHGDDGGVINVLEPHPHSPVLATSGLDHDVKVWAPTAKQPTELDGLKQLVRTNRKEREEERASEPDMIDGQMLWLLMQHLRRTTRRRAREEGDDASSSTSDSDEQSDDDDDDGSEEMPEGVQCASS